MADSHKQGLGHAQKIQTSEHTPATSVRTCVERYGRLSVLQQYLLGHGQRDLTLGTAWVAAPDVPGTVVTLMLGAC